MNRRQALKTMMGALGLTSTASVFGASAFMGGALSATRPVLLEEELFLLDEIGETIIPQTDDSPGAKAVGIGQFMQAMVSDYYDRGEQQRFLLGLGRFRALLRERFDRDFSERDFAELELAEREAVLLDLERDPEADYYRMIKQLTVWGYFSSEAGAKQALRYAPIPGRYDGRVKIEPGARAWANLLP